MALAGRTVLVSGGSEGIGFAVARQVVDAGGQVVITGRRADVLEAAVEKLGESASGSLGDLGVAGTAEEAVAHAVAKFGRLDGVVCNAASFVPGLVIDQPMDQVDQMIAVNLRGHIALMSAAAKAMVDSPGAAAVIVSSDLTAHPTAGTGIYGATKAALNYLVSTWSAELAPLDIRVNGIVSGATATEGFLFTAGLMPGLADATVSTNLIKRLAEPTEIANIIVTLLDSEVTGYVTGSLWPIDGGGHRDHQLIPG